MKFSLSNWIIAKAGDWLLKDRPPRRAYLCNFQQINKKIKGCDVLLIEGRSRISNVIQVVTKSPWSHACLYIGKFENLNAEIQAQIKKHYQGNLDEPLVIETELGKGTIVSPLVKYQNDHIRILRANSLTSADGLKVIRYAANRLGVKYDMRHVFDLARFLFPWSFFPREWRSTLFQHNALQPTKDICSSMIAEAFYSIGFPILPLVNIDKEKHYELIQRNPQLFTPSDFDFSPYFNIIKYPIMGKNINFHALHWNKKLISDDNEILRRLESSTKIDENT
jgi:hypothetical protein